MENVYLFIGYKNFKIQNILVFLQLLINGTHKGQALITLLFFTVIGVTVTTAAVLMLLVNSLSGAKQQQGELAYEVAQSGIEDALIRFLRDPSFSVEDLQVGSNIAHVERSGSGPYIFVSTGTVGIFTRKVQVTVTYQGNLMNPTGRKEIYN